MRALGASRTSLVPGGVLAGPWVKNELWRRARAVPSLDLRFADNKSLTDAVTGASLVTFTRASSGTYVDSAGVLQTAATDVPRFDHNPTTGESLGLLVEEARTNLLLRSEAIATSPWFGGANTTLTNNTGEVLDPAGGSTATKVEVAVSGGIGAFGQGATLTAVVHSGSIWLRCATGTVSANLIVYLGGPPFTNIGTTNVTITTTWQRFSVVTSTATAAAYNFQLNNIAAGTVYAWGAQLEAGAFATSYIPTTTAAATRNADLASITGSAFSGWYRQDEGTMFAEGRAVNNGVIAVANDGSFDNRKPQLNLGAIGSVDANYVAAGSLVASFTQVSSVGISNRWATAYAVDNFGFSSNGLAPAQDSSGALPSGINALRLGSFQNGSSYANGPIQRICFWPQRLPNSTLQQITQ